MGALAHSWASSGHAKWKCDCQLNLGGLGTRLGVRISHTVVEGIGTHLKALCKEDWLMV